ncbi:adenylate kinase, chloroplastic isoform X2 [Syzygium oleosum]|uniref:adenylate kinase, chloroplastic isoform X2 n=1 Tax=Syzygium oleosum TaxID=219896 RepID=UPI0024B9A7AB|nr:adenylate kinase, chloroplastic isoform X2 [Syzygium oleosum]
MAMACSGHMPVEAAKPQPRTHFLACDSPSNSRKIFASSLHFLGKDPAPCRRFHASHIKNAPFARRSKLAVSRSDSIRDYSLELVAMAKPDPLKIMLSGAPASGKGTQCELITKKYGLVHIAAGDLLRAEVAAGSENGKRAKEYMEKGQLVPDEIVVMMVKERLLQSDSLENGWLLDGYPRSLSQATALQEFGLQADLFILLEVPEEILVERVVGRRLDPVTGRIYHLKYSPPETEEIAARLTRRFDDTEEKVKLRLRTHHQNVEAVLSMYKDITIKVNGDAPKENVFAQIDNALSKLLEQGKATSGSLAA